MNEKNAKIEAILFACGEAVEIERLAIFLKISKEEIKDEVKNLQEFYEKQQGGLQIIVKGNTIQLVSNSKFGGTIAKFLDRKINEPLTRAALEVLAIVAYRGPMTKLEIDHIRGVNCGFMVRNLAMRGLIEKNENIESARSYSYLASFDFLKSMGIGKINELPDYELFSKTDIKQGVKDSEDSEVCENNK